MLIMIGKTLSGKYNLLELISEGGTSEVFLAEDNATGEKVVIKLIKEHLLYGHKSEKYQILERLKRELQIAEQLKNENIIIAKSLNEDNGRYYIVLDYVPGISLFEIINKEIIGTGFILRLMIELCTILDYAHSLGIVHRDLKPSNIMISNDGKIKILDFGYAIDTINSNKLTHDGAILGTASYLAPEQAMNSTVDNRADLYSLGVILYELLTGRKPFIGKSKITVIMQHLNDLPKSPTVYNPYIPSLIEKITMKLLEKKPEDRFSGAKELLTELKKVFQEGELSENITSKGINILNKRAYLIGRDEEFKSLYNDVDSLKNKEKVEPVVLNGLYGTGKTRLLEEIEIYAKMRNILFIKGSSIKERRYVPYYPITQALDIFFETEKSNIWHQLFHDKYTELKELADTIYPSLVPLLDYYRRKEDTEIIPNVSEFLVEFLVELSDIKPFIIAIDDLQWADISTFNLLCSLNLQKKSNIFVIATIDETKLNEAITGINLWNSKLTSKIININNLTPEETGEMVKSILMTEEIDEKFLQKIYIASKGNPLFIKEAINLLSENGNLSWQDKNWLVKNDFKMPSSLEQLIQIRLEQISPPIRELLNKASILGKNFFGSYLNFLLEEEKSNVITEEVKNYLFDQAIKNKLIEKETRVKEEVYNFVTQELREFFYNNIGEDKKQEYHSKIAQKLELTYEEWEIPDLIELSYHFTLGKDVSLSNFYLIQAGDKVKTLGLNDGAKEIYSMALEQSERYNLEEDLENLRKKLKELN